MKKSYKKLIIFDVVVLIILLLNSLILNILGNYYYMDLFLILLLVAFKYIFGLERDKHRYIKDIIVNISIILMISFILYYILGIFIGFYKPDNYFTLYGIFTFIVPYIIMVVVREFLRWQMLNKVEKSKVFTIVTFLLFTTIEVSVRMASSSLSTSYNIFIFIALTVLPAISNNIVGTYIATKVGYKPNIFWMLIIGLYAVILPIVPNAGTYVRALIELLFPFVLMYNTFSFFQKRSKDIPISYIKKRVYVEIYSLALLVFVLAYFISGHFRYYAVAVATGSMMPKIAVGDVVIIDQYRDYKTLEIGEIIAYKYHGVVVVHRLYDKVRIKDDYYFYTKGDANDVVDNYIIYPDTILGSVKLKLPYIGIPTVWLNKMFEKKK